MIVSINQPAYIPWLGYFERIARSDVHIVLDHVQFEKNSMVNRNKIRTKSGWCWLTVPLKTKGMFGDLAIKDIQTSDQVCWAQKHLKSIQLNYSRAPFFSSLFPALEEALLGPTSHLSPLIDRLTKALCLELGIHTPFKYSSELNPQQAKSSLVLELCQKVGATTYLSGSFGKDYLDVESFEDGNIGVTYQEYAHPEYRQAYPGFESHMSVIDLIFNHGPASLQLLAP